MVLCDRQATKYGGKIAVSNGEVILRRVHSLQIVGYFKNEDKRLGVNKLTLSLSGRNTRIGRFMYSHQMIK